MEITLKNPSQCLQVLALNIKIPAALELKALFSSLKQWYSWACWLLPSLSAPMSTCADIPTHMCRHKHTCGDGHTHTLGFQTSYSHTDSGFHHSVPKSGKAIPRLPPWLVTSYWPKPDHSSRGDHTCNAFTFFQPPPSKCFYWMILSPTFIGRRHEKHLMKHHFCFTPIKRNLKYCL